MKRSVGLVALATVFLLGNDPVLAQESNTKKAEERTAFHENSTLNLLNASPAEFRRFLQRWSPNRLAKNCENEPHNDSRVGWLYPIPGGAWFLVGRAGDLETNIEDMIRMYHVEKYLKTGTPLKGQIYIKLQAETARQERACLGTLQEMPVRWIVSNNESPDAGETVEMGCAGSTIFQRSKGGFGRRYNSDWRNCCEPHVIRKLVVNGLSQADGTSLGRGAWLCRQRMA